MTNEETTTIEVEVAKNHEEEIAYAILGRAMDIHSNPHDDYEWLAVALKEEGNRLRDKYE